MPSPREAFEKLNRITMAWETLAPDASFGGMSLQEYRDAIAPSFEARDRIARLEAELVAAKNARDGSDRDSLSRTQLVVNGVIGDPERGPDSDLYEAMGYVRRSERRTGLTRRRSEPAEA